MSRIVSSKRSEVRGLLQRGFALLEAIVALAILAAAGLALFTALSQSLQMIARADAAMARAELSRSALALIDAIDPMAWPQGSMLMGEFSLTWRAELLEPAEGNATGTLATGFYQLGLYDLNCRVVDGNQEIYRFVVRKVGYRQVREPVPL